MGGEVLYSLRDSNSCFKVLKNENMSATNVAPGKATPVVLHVNSRRVKLVP